jgi:hypothetical protein
VIDEIKDIGNMIKEYGLDKGILTDIIKETYDTLMKHKWHGIAATLAKKYGL